MTIRQWKCARTIRVNLHLHTTLTARTDPLVLVIKHQSRSHKIHTNVDQSFPAYLHWVVAAITFQVVEHDLAAKQTNPDQKHTISNGTTRWAWILSHICMLSSYATKREKGEKSSSANNSIVFINFQSPIILSELHDDACHV